MAVPSNSFVLTRHSQHIILIMNTKLLLGTAIVALSCLSYAYAGQMFILDDEDINDHIRVRRSPQVQRRDSGGPPVFLPIASEKSDPYSPPVSYGKSPKSYKKGRVGPVYTFVKTDPYANFKWGVRHVVGHKYGR
jgi:hypothetical protein